MRPRPLHRKLLLPLAAALVLPASAAFAADKAPSASPPPPAAAKPSPPEPPRRATPEERAMAERLDPLARAAFWAHEAQIDARDVQAGVRLAAALRTLGRNDEAAAAAEHVLVVDPSSREALLESARAHLAAGQGFYAIDPLNRLKAQDPRDWRYVSLLGVAYEQVSRTEDAEAAWTQALQMSPDNPAVLSNLAMHYASRGQGSEAERLLRQAAAQPGASLQVRQNLALILGLEGKLAEAERLERQDLPPELAEANMAYLKAASARTGPLAQATPASADR
jgi:Flp pilus assembly protein TadD